MPRIAVFGGDGYLSSLIKNHNLIKKNNYIFFREIKILNTILIIHQ